MGARFATILVLLIFPSVALMAAQYPPSYRWRTVTTPHFFIHFHQGEEQLAERAAGIAERAHTHLTREMKWEPRERTHLILSDHIDLSNGSATYFPANRIEVYVTAPGADPASPLEYYDDWLNLVIIHEYAHILHLDQSFGLPAALRRVFGRNPLLFPNTYSPLWITEGLATLVESDATSTGRLHGTYLDMVLRTAAIEESFPGAQQASGLTPKWPGGGARYFFGARFLDWLKKRYGREKLTEFFNRYASSLVPYRINAVAEEVFGTPLDDLFESWTVATKSSYEQEHAALASSRFSERTHLTHLGYETRNLALSPDGGRLAFTHEGPYEKPTLRVIDVNSGSEVARNQINHGSRLSWSPDGKSIAYSQLEFHHSFSLLSDLYVWEVGGRARQITSAQRLKDPAFTRDGKKVIAIETGAGRNAIVVADIATGELRRIVDGGDELQFSEPFAHPTEDAFVVAEWRRGRVHVVVYALDGIRLRNLTEALPFSVNASPSISPDGLTVYFSSDATRISNIYSVPWRGGTLRRHTHLYGGAFSPASAGRAIYYADYSSRGFDLARSSADTSYDVGTPTDWRPPVPEASAAAIVPSKTEPYSPWSSLRPRWWLPLFFASTTDVLVGAATTGSDVLGFHQYQAQIAASFGENDDLTYALQYVYDRFWPTVAITASRSAQTFDEAQFQHAGELFDYDETVDRMELEATFPYRRYNWGASASLAGIYSKHSDDLEFEVTGDALRPFDIYIGTLRGARASFEYSNARERGYAISPENGIASSLSLERVTGEEVEQERVVGDLRAYLRIPWRRSPLGRHVLAARFAAAVTEGDRIFQREIRVGGVGSSFLVEPELPALPVRGFASGELRGDRGVAGSVEYRFPLWEIDRGPAVFPLYFYRLLGAAFYDTGSAWSENAPHRPHVSEGFDEETTLSSIGAEVGLDFFVGYSVPLRYRLGIAVPVTTPEGVHDTVQIYSALGTSF